MAHKGKMASKLRLAHELKAGRATKGVFFKDNPGGLESMQFLCYLLQLSFFQQDSVEIFKSGILYNTEDDSRGIPVQLEDLSDLLIFYLILISVRRSEKRVGIKYAKNGLGRKNFENYFSTRMMQTQLNGYNNFLGVDAISKRLNKFHASGLIYKTKFNLLNKDIQQYIVDMEVHVPTYVYYMEHKDEENNFFHQLDKGYMEADKYEMALDRVLPLGRFIKTVANAVNALPLNQRELFIDLININKS